MTKLLMAGLRLASVPDGSFGGAGAPIYCEVPTTRVLASAVLPRYTPPWIENAKE